MWTNNNWRQIVSPTSIQSENPVPSSPNNMERYVIRQIRSAVVEEISSIIRNISDSMEHGRRGQGKEKLDYI